VNSWQYDEHSVLPTGGASGAAARGQKILKGVAKWIFHMKKYLSLELLRQKEIL